MKLLNHKFIPLNISNMSIIRTCLMFGCNKGSFSYNKSWFGYNKSQFCCNRSSLGCCTQGFVTFCGHVSSLFCSIGDQCFDAIVFQPFPSLFITFAIEDTNIYSSGNFVFRVDASYDGSFLWQNDVFFPVYPLFKMHMAINIFLDLLIGTWI